MTCAACGKENREGRKFCAKCGAPLALQCPACGTANEPDEDFCGECGGQLQGVKGLRGYGVRRLSPESDRQSLTPNPITPDPPAVSRKTISIVFADLMGSTALQERLDPESVNRVMDAYYQAVRGPVEAAGGTVVQLLGDGVFCAFGIPRIAEDDALRAVRAAVGVQRAFREFLQGQQWLNVPIGLRVAVNTGEVVVSDEHPAGIGDPLNVAARLQLEARDGEVLIGQATRRLVADAVTLERAGVFALKGRTETVTAYRVVSLERPKGATTAFVGRDEELARLSAVYEAAVAKPAAKLAVLLGSPGLGKSRLIEELGQRLGGQANVIAAQCDAAGGATFAPIAEALREFLHAGDGDWVPLLTGTVDKREDTLRRAQGERKKSFEINPPTAQAELVEASFRRKSTVPTKEGLGEVDLSLGTPPPGSLLRKAGGPDKSIHAAIEALLPGNDADRARIAAAISALLAGSPASPEETFFVIRRFLTALARQRPVVLVIDDLQWAEPLLLDLVEHLIQWGSGVPLFVLVGARPELRDRRSSLATVGGFVSEVATLSGLDAGAAMRLAANVIGAADLPATVAAKVLATSEGNPLFVGELVRMLVDEGAIEKQGERWIVGANLAVLEMPPTIHALLAARIERLRPEERTVLERAAVVGRHFSRSAVAALLGSNGNDLDARLEALRRTELIEPDSGWFLGEPVLRFHHVLIRDAAYRRLLKGTRAEMHERLANWIEGQVKDAAEHDETIGWHLEQAHQLLRELGPIDAEGKALGERAAQRLSAAGRRALARDDVPVAADLLGRAIERLDAHDSGRADLALDWCEALLSAGDVGPAARAIEELARFVGGSPFETPPKDGGSSGRTDQQHTRESLSVRAEEAASSQRPSRSPLRLRAWHTCFVGQLTVMTAPQELQATADAVAAAAEEFAKLDDAAGEAKAHSVHAQALARLGRVGACEAALDKALAAARKAGDRRRANAVLAGAPLAALWGPSPVTRASGRCLDVVRVLRITQGAPAVEAVALSCQGVLEALRGRTDAARRMIASSRKMVEELGIAHRLFEADVFAGRIDLLEGDAEAAERKLRGAHDGLRDLGLGIDAARAGSLLARALLFRGEIAEAERLTHESEQLAGDDLQAAIAWRGVRAEALARRGEHGAAIELAQAAVTIAAATDALLDHADARLALAAALRAAGRGGEADAEERRAIELWEAKGATLPAESVRREARVAPVGGALLPPVDLAPGMCRRVAPNAATAMQTRFDAVLAARDFDEIRSIFSESFEEIDHPTGSLYGSDESLASLRRLFRSRDPSYDVEPLATLGPSLLLVRRRSRASGATSGRYDVGEYENEAIQLLEVDEHQRLCRSEVFGADHLGDAIARLYERYAEQLPDDPSPGGFGSHAVSARDRAATTARAAAAMLTRSTEHRLEDVMVPDLQAVDHRTIGPLQGPDLPSRWRAASDELAQDQAFRVDDVLALSADGLLRRTTQSGKVRASGGAFETSSWALSVFGSDGRQTRFEIFDVGHEAEALARFDQLITLPAPARPVRRGVRANTATRSIARFAESVAVRDADTLAELLAERFELVHHPTAATYGRRGMLTTWRSLFGAERLAFRHELLATLGESLALHRHLVSAEGFAEEHLRSAGPIELEEICLTEVDGDGRALRFELFASDHLGDAVARLYERHVELLPAGADRTRAVATARTVAALFAHQPNIDADWSTLAPSFEFVDHRILGFESLRGRDAARPLMRSLFEVSDRLSVRTDDVLALDEHAYIIRFRWIGAARDAGDLEREILALFSFDDEGRFARVEYFDVGREAEALARFAELAAGAPPDPLARIAKPNAAHAAMQRWLATYNHVAETGDWEPMREVCVALVAFEDRRRLFLLSGGLDLMMASARERLSIGARPHLELLGTAGDRIAIERVLWSGGPSDGPFEIEYLGLWEVDETGQLTTMMLFDTDEAPAVRREAWARWAAMDPTVAEVTAALRKAIDGWKAQDLERLRAAFAEDLVVEDHRRTGTGRSEGREAYLRSVAALWDLAPESSFEAGWFWLAISPHAGAYTARRSGRLRSGGEFESDFLVVATVAHGRTTRVEIFEIDAADAALARFEELRVSG